MIPRTAPDDRPIEVLSLGYDKHLFKATTDPRLRLRLAAEDPDAEADWLIVPVSTGKNVGAVQTFVPSETLRRRLKSGQTGVIFDSSLEARIQDGVFTGILHGFLKQWSVRRGNAVYVTQERNYAADYRAWCAREGVAEPMGVVFHDYWIWRFFINFARNGEAVFHERHLAFKRRTAERERRFIALNFTARAHKLLFLLSLVRDGVFDRGFVSFGGFEHMQRHVGVPRSELERQTLELGGFQDLAAELAPLFPQLDAYGQVVFGGVGEARKGKTLVSDHDMPEYGRSWFSVITETEMWTRPSRVTEKPFKALVNFHPFLMIGNPGSLKLIRDFGFLTFQGMIDERYDEEPDPRRRFDMVYAQVLRLARMDEAELARLSASISERLLYNARWGLTQAPTLHRARYERALVDEILLSMRR